MMPSTILLGPMFQFSQTDGESISQKGVSSREHFTVVTAMICCGREEDDATVTFMGGIKYGVADDRRLIDENFALESKRHGKDIGLPLQYCPKNCLRARP